MTKSLLSQVSVATPCTVPWETMQGDERARACAQCKLTVYNLSSMSSVEAESFLSQKKDGRRCIRFYRRADGTILTDDCPVGLKRLRDASKRCIALLSPLVSLLLCLLPARAQNSAAQEKVQNPTTASRLRGLVRCDSRENSKGGGSDAQNSGDGSLNGNQQNLTKSHRFGWVYGDEGQAVDIDALKEKIESGGGTAMDRLANQLMLDEAERNYEPNMQFGTKENFEGAKLTEKIEPDYPTAERFIPQAADEADMIDQSEIQPTAKSNFHSDGLGEVERVIDRLDPTQAKRSRSGRISDVIY